MAGHSLLQGLCGQGGGFSLCHMQLAQRREVAKFTTFPASASDFPGSVLSLSFSNLLPSLVTMENEMPVPFKLSAE